MEEDKALLSVEHIRIEFHKKNKVKTVVDDLSFTLNKGEILGIVGESGSGKTMTALAIMDLLHPNARVSGSIKFNDKDLFQLKKEELRKMKGREIAMIFQEPMTSLNPLLTIGYQIEEMLMIHENLKSRGKLNERVLTALTDAGLIEPEILYHKYPHELSGGMRQRVMIAMAMILKPKILIADEPTTALDVTIQKKILELIKKLNVEYGISVILISHDLGVIKTICKKALVMKDGKIVEMGHVNDLFLNPKKEYTKKLIDAMPTIKKGLIHNTTVNKHETILKCNNLNVFYEVKSGKLFQGKKKKHVVKNVSLELKVGETLGIVGESGCGKSSLAKAIVGLNKDVTGQIKYEIVKPQMVFQDPYGSLNPMKKIEWILEEPLLIAGIKDKELRQEKVDQVLLEVGLTTEHKQRYISELSGGQRQRVAIGVALIQNSKLIVLDEPVSALDVTVQAQILSLLKKLQREHNLSYLFISHDLNVIYQMCDRICVMYMGEIVETGTLYDIYENPQNDYTKKLLASILKL